MMITMAQKGVKMVFDNKNKLKQNRNEKKKCEGITLMQNKVESQYAGMWKEGGGAGALGW